MEKKWIWRRKNGWLITYNKITPPPADGGQSNVGQTKRKVLFCLEIIKIQKYRFEALTFRK